MIRGLGADRVEHAGARGIDGAAEVGGPAALVADGDVIERGVVARPPARSWAPRPRLDDATTDALREQIAIGRARLIVG